MKTSFDFISLVALRKEDRIFSLMKKDARLEFFIAFLYEAFESKNRKQILYDDFMVMLRNFIKEETLNLQTNGIENFNYENAYNSMLEYKLITTKIDWAKNASNKYVVTTTLYGDVIHFLEERAGNITIGGVKQIETALSTIGDAVALMVGDVEIRKKHLKEKIAVLQKELNSITKDGKVRNVTKEEKRSYLHVIDREIAGFGEILNRGALRLKNDNDLVWKDIRDRINSNEQVKIGEAAYLQFEAIDKFYNSDTAKGFNNAVNLLANEHYKTKLNSYINYLYKNEEIKEIMVEDGIDIKLRNKQILKYYRNCSEEVNKAFLKLNAFIQSNEIKHNQELSKKATELLAACVDYGKNNLMRNRVFPYYSNTLSVVSPDKRYLQDIKSKQKLINKTVEGVVPEKIEPTVFRDISLADIPNKFKKLLDKYDGEFDLEKYMTDEGTFLGMYEFITVMNIMNRYMPKDIILACIDKGSKLFKVVDFAPLDKTKQFTEQNIFATNFIFNKEAYEVWKQDSFKM